jgi:hypothetical protein
MELIHYPGAADADFDVRVEFVADGDEMPDYAAAAIIGGNGIDWDTPIWLADDQAAAMIEAGMLDATPVATVDVDSTTIHCHEKAGA